MRSARIEKSHLNFYGFIILECLKSNVKIFSIICFSNSFEKKSNLSEMQRVTYGRKLKTMFPISTIKIKTNTLTKCSYLGYVMLVNST